MELLTPTRGPAPTFVGDLATHGAAPAIVDARGEVSYAALAAIVRDRARQLGTTRRLVAIEVSNDRDPLCWYLAALHGGHAVLLLNADAPDASERLAGAYDVDVVVRTSAGRSALVERRAGSAHVLHPDLALLLSTSGSTGSPKLVRLSRENLDANADAIAEYLDLGPSDRAMTTLPLHYCYGLSVLHSHLARGASVVLTNHSVVDPCFWDAFRQAGATSFAAVPHTFELLDRVGFAAMSLPTLRYVTQAGGRLAPAKVRAYATLGAASGWDLFVMYGQTEATARMAYLPPALAASHPDVIGVPVPGGSIHIDPVEGLDDGSGELVYRGPNVMLGYAEGPEDLAAGRTVHELRTGDLARRTSEGLYQVVGRRSRFVKVFGLRIDLDRIEAGLAEHGVEALCTGEDGALAVAATTGAGVEHVRRLVCHQSGLPAGAVVVGELDAMPRLPTGKPDYVAVREQLLRDRRAGGAVGASLRDVRALYAQVLQCGDVPPDATFVGLGGDSLSYVEMSLALEELLGSLPPGWHTMPVSRLEQMGRPLGTGARPSRLKQVETGVVLRAVAIVMIVGSHAGLFERRGGAHLLLGIAGYNFARFSLGAERSPARSVLASAARIAVPAMCWIALLVATTDDYSLANIGLLNGHLGSRVFDERWRYWFIEVLVQSLVVLAVAFAIPAVRRAERAHRFAFAAGVLALGLALRYGILELIELRHRTVQPQTVFWLFALGWAAERARSVPQRLAVSLVAVIAVRGFFFDEPVREAIVAAGILAILWVPRIGVPRALDRILAPLAGASLYIYLTHWHVYPTLNEHATPLVAVLGSIAVGIGFWVVVRRATRVVEAALGRLRREPAHSSERTGTSATAVTSACGSGTPTSV